MKKFTIEGRNAVLGLSVQARPLTGCSCRTDAGTGRFPRLPREARKHDTMIQFVTRERLNQMSETGKHQGG